MSVVAGGGAGVDQDDPQVGRLPLQRVPEEEQRVPDGASQDVVARDAVAVAGTQDLAGPGPGTAAGDDESDRNTFESALEAQEEAALEARLRLAAEEDPAAGSLLGAMLLRRGDPDDAEPYLRRAAASGIRAGANNLGVLLHQRGHREEAAQWWRAAAVAGSAPAAHALGLHLRDHGDEPGSEYWLHQAAEQGHTGGAYALADLLEHRRETVRAERWFRAAAETGHREEIGRASCRERV